MSKKRLFRAALIFGSGFVCGIAAVILVAYIASRMDDGVISAEGLVSKWHLAEDAEGNLLIPLWEEGVSSSAPDRSVLIKCEQETKKLHWIGIVDSAWEPTLTYRVDGHLGIPEFQYHGGNLSEENWTSLVDINCDGSFDHRLQVAGENKSVEIKVDDAWLLAEKIIDGRAVTAKGDYVFSLETGKYELAPAAIEAPAAD